MYPLKGALTKRCPVARTDGRDAMLEGGKWDEITHNDLDGCSEGKIAFKKK